MAKVTLFVVDEDEAIAESVIDVSDTYTIPTLPPVELLYLPLFPGPNYVLIPY